MEQNFSKELVIDEWQRFIEAVNHNPSIRPVIIKAWKRCRDLGLKPENIKFLFLSDCELKQKICDNSKLIEVAKPYMDHLSLSLNGIPHMVALSDEQGWIIDYRGVPDELGGKSVGLCIGASWAEKNIGNNGIGTALTTGKPVFIYGIEHYGAVYGSCGCIGVPIRDNCKIIGALDISVPIQYANPARLHLVAACVSSIESTLSNILLNTFRTTSDKQMSATTELIATAVHDLKNPLAVIRGLGQLGKLVTNDSKVINYFDRVIKQSDEMNNIIIDLLGIFRPEELVIKKISPIIKEILQEFEPICASQNIKLIYKNISDEYINISERLLKRSIGNLITNAIQAIESEGLIEIKTKVQDKDLIITVRDTAGGIPEELKDSLFEPFTFKRSQGTGLGLFMVYHTITTTHRGDIWFESKKGKGTTFYIKLPLSNERPTDDIYLTHKLI